MRCSPPLPGGAVMAAGAPEAPEHPQKVQQCIGSTAWGWGFTIPGGVEGQTQY